MSTVELLVQTLIQQDDARPRTQATGIGPSSLGGCARKVALDLLGAHKPNAQVERFASIKGTAIHEAIERAFVAHLDPEEEQTEITLPGIPALRINDGHADLYRKSLGRIVDWKTTLKKSLRYFPGTHRLWQTMTYGYMARSAGLEVREVEIVAIPLDGQSTDIASWVLPYDERVVEQAFDWQRGVLSRVEAIEHTGDLDYLPPPDRPRHTFCAPYCPYYGPDSCPGRP